MAQDITCLDDWIVWKKKAEISRHLSKLTDPSLATFINIKKTQLKCSRPGPVSSFTIVTPPFILLELLSGNRDQWVAQVSLLSFTPPVTLMTPELHVDLIQHGLNYSKGMYKEKQILSQRCPRAVLLQPVQWTPNHCMFCISPSFNTPDSTLDSIVIFMASNLFFQSIFARATFRVYSTMDDCEWTSLTYAQNPVNSSKQFKPHLWIFVCTSSTQTKRKQSVVNVNSQSILQA